MSKGWIGVDLDGTLARYDKWRGETHIGEPIPAMLARVQAWLDADQEVRIFTARVGARDEQELDAVRSAINRWSMTHFGVVLPVTNEKDYSMIELWDDRAVRVVRNTGEPCCDHASRKP